MLCSEKKLIGLAKEFQPDIIGISCVTANINSGKLIAAKIKTFFPGALYIGGGPHLSARPQDGFPVCDAVVVGEGEKSFLAIIAQWLDGTGIEDISVPGIVVCRDSELKRVPVNRIVDLDELPFPDRSLLEIEKYYHSYPYRTANNRFTTIFTSRGCNFNCSFCGTHITFPGGKKFFSLPYIKEEINHVVRDHNCSLIFFDDDEFLLEQERVVNICEFLIDKQYPLKWICHGRPEGADATLMKLMKRAGCVEIQVGVESGSEYILDKMGRHYGLDQVYRFFAAANKARMNTWATFILGYPGETEKTLNETLKLALKVNPSYASFITLLPFPGTRVFNELVEQNNIKTFNWSHYSWHSNNPVYISKNMKAGMLIQKRADLLRKFYLRPQKIISIGKDMIKARKVLEMTRNLMAWLSIVLKTKSSSR